MQFTPLIAIHMTAALGALATGPVALWARRAGAQRPRLHRAFGYASGRGSRPADSFRSRD